MICKTAQKTEENVVAEQSKLKHKEKVIKKQNDMFEKAARFAVTRTDGFPLGDLEFPLGIGRDESELLIKSLVDSGVVSMDPETKRFKPVMTEGQVEQMIADRQDVGAPKFEEKGDDPADTAGDMDSVLETAADAYGEIVDLNCDQITVRDDLQVRVALSDEAVKNYVDILREADDMPPIDVFTDGREYWVVDGFHRLAAAKEIVLVKIKCRVFHGSYAEALAHAALANQRHGVRLTNADKQRTVTLLLKCDEHCHKSDRALGEMAGVDKNTAARYRAHLEASGEIHQSEKRIGRDGRKLESPAPVPPKNTVPLWLTRIPGHVAKYLEQNPAAMTDDEKTSVKAVLDASITALEQLRDDIDSSCSVSDVAA